jgi:L,D-peptidoglycan transpeptidase YkuD (ErfK/YbiS/YcfS/YnhG family)
MRIPAFLLLCCFCTAASSSTQPPSWAKVGTQLIVVISADWQSPAGELHTFERRTGRWVPHAGPFNVSLGRNGSAWGLGLHPKPSEGPIKVEGDGKAPAGVFKIGTAFGYASGLPTALPYKAMTASDWCVDVNDSPLYNRIVSTDQVGQAAVAGSSEPMRRDIHLNGDDAYRKGFVIQHNPENQPKAGSCIFAHLWKAPGAPTAGCTAMPEADMTALLGWLDADRNPVFVLLPAAQYHALRKTWHLPELKN